MKYLYITARWREPYVVREKRKQRGKGEKRSEVSSWCVAPYEKYMYTVYMIYICIYVYGTIYALHKPIYNP